MYNPSGITKIQKPFLMERLLSFIPLFIFAIKLECYLPILECLKTETNETIINSAAYF